MATPKRERDDGLATEVLRQIEQRLAHIESELGQLKALLTKQQEPQRPWWENFVGIHEGDEVFDRVVKYMEEERRKDYEKVIAEIEGKSRRKSRKAKRAKTKE